MQRRRVESLVLGAFHHRHTVHRAFVLVLGANIAALLDCSKSSRQCSLSYLLTYLPEVIRSCCHHHHHHHHHTRSSRGRFEWSARFHRPSRRVAGPGKRHSARGTPRAQPRDVRSAGRDTWNLTGEALGGPRKRSWRRCSRARSRGAARPSGALTQVPSTAPNPQIPPRAPRSARAPLTLRPTPAAALVQPGRACAEPADRPVLARAGGFAGVLRRLVPAPAPRGPTSPFSSASAVSSGSIGAPTPLASPAPLPEV